MSNTESQEQEGKQRGGNNRRKPWKRVTAKQEVHEGERERERERDRESLEKKRGESAALPGTADSHRQGVRTTL